MKRRNFLQIATGSIAAPFILSSTVKANILPANIDDKDWYKILKLGYDRNMIICNRYVPLGNFTSELVTISCEIQCSDGYVRVPNPHLTLTDIYMSDHAFEKYGCGFVDVESTLVWGEKRVRIEINCSVNLHSLMKLNYKNKYYSYLIDQLGVTSYGNHHSFAVGLRLGRYGLHSNIQKQDILLMSF